MDQSVNILFTSYLVVNVRTGGEYVTLVSQVAAFH